jgi:hypothetical protein
MNLLTKAIGYGAIAILLVIPTSCGKQGYCDSDYFKKDKLCYKKTSVKPDASTPIKDAEMAEEGGDAESAKVPTGFADSCTTNEQCAGKEADYCAVNPLEGKGMCTVRGCNSNDECPSDYYCCLAKEELGGHMCVGKTLYDMGKGADAC